MCDGEIPKQESLILIDMPAYEFTTPHWNYLKITTVSVIFPMYII